MFGKTFLQFCKTMVSITNKLSWEDVSPIVLFWTISAEINKLKDFLRLVEELTHEQDLRFIWQITQTNALLLMDNEPEIQAVYECIICSPQLTVKQTEMHCDSDRFFLRDQYTSIKANIAAFFKQHEHTETAFYMTTMITRVLQLSSNELVEELFQHYNDIWKNLVNWQNYDHCCSRGIVMPLMVSIEEHHFLHREMYADNNHRNRDLLLMNDRLQDKIVACRYDDLNQLEHNIELQLTDLHQALKDHLL